MQEARQPNVAACPLVECVHMIIRLQHIKAILLQPPGSLLASKESDACTS